MNRIFICLITLLGMILPAHAQTTARAEVISYNSSVASLILSLTDSDIRYHQIRMEGSIVSITIDDVTREAYLIPSEMDTGDHYQTVRLLGYAPTRQENPLALIVARSGSALQHFDRATNPLQTFDAEIGDLVRVSQITPPPIPIQRETEAPVFAVSEDGSLYLDFSQYEAEQSGLLPGISGTIALGGNSLTFEMVQQDTYITILEPVANLYTYITDLPRC